MWRPVAGMGWVMGRGVLVQRRPRSNATGGAGRAGVMLLMQIQRAVAFVMHIGELGVNADILYTIIIIYI